MAPELNRVERAKRERDGLSVRNELERYAREGAASIDPDDRDIRLKWLGLYTQRPEEDGFFMLRIKSPGGQLTSAQAHTLGEISVLFGRSTADITTRQNIQLHWVCIEDTPEIFRRLEAVGLTSSGACGDTVRVVVGCPAAGLDAHEVEDATYLIEAVTRATIDNPDFVDLPRKFKISIGGCRYRCHQPAINDIGLSAIKRADGSVVYDVAVGGGLSTVPKLATRLGVAARPDQVVDVVKQITGIFRDHGNRQNRAKARLKFLVAEWGAARFLEELERRLGYALESAPADLDTVPTYADHLGLVPGKVPGTFTIGVPVPTGRLLGERLATLGDLAERYGDGRVRLTNMQNVLLGGVRREHVEAVTSQLTAIGLPVQLDSFRKSLVSCTGLEFCKLAVTETKSFAGELVEWLDREIGVEEGFRINVNGCPNSCGQHWIADIGLQGVLLKDAEGVEHQGFQLFFGGVLGASFAQRVPTRVPAERIKHAIGRIIQSFRAERNDGERFAEYTARVGQERIRGFIEGLVTA